jgi:hypothetical protein
VQLQSIILAHPDNVIVTGGRNDGLDSQYGDAAAALYQC